MAKCSFCNSNIERGTGFIYVLNEGKVLDFCSRKCEKNLFKLKSGDRPVRGLSCGRDTAYAGKNKSNTKQGY